MIVVEGRVLSPSVYRASSFVELEDTVAWWGSLATLGALLVAAGVLLGADRGELVAIGGVTLFFATAVLAGAERPEPATSLGVAGVVWTSAGVSLALGTDPSLVGSMLGLSVAGAILLALGAGGAVRAHARSPPVPVRGG